MGHRAGEVQFSVARGRCLHEAEIDAHRGVYIGVAIGDKVNCGNNSLIATTDKCLKVTRLS